MHACMHACTKLAKWCAGANIVAIDAEDKDDNPRPAAARLPITQCPAGSSKGAGQAPSGGTLTGF